MSTADLTTSVRYADIPGFLGYRIGDDGTVWSQRTRNGKSSQKWRRLATHKDYYGYNIVNLRSVGRKHTRRVCRLVLEAFVGPCPPVMECCHWDGTRDNDRLSNLRWDGSRGNKADANRHGTSSRGSRNGFAKLTETNVTEILRLISEGDSQSHVARIFGVGQTTVSRILRGVTWAHVPRERENVMSTGGNQTNPQAPQQAAPQDQAASQAQQQAAQAQQQGGQQPAQAPQAAPQAPQAAQAPSQPQSAFDVNQAAQELPGAALDKLKTLGVEEFRLLGEYFVGRVRTHLGG